MSGNEQHATDRIAAALCGANLASVEAWESGWAFSFSSGATVTTQSTWRVLTAEGVAITSEDHRQQFGLPAPVDAGQRAASVLPGKITSIELVPVTSDLRISFGPAAVLEFLNTSSGYEGWHLVARQEERKTLEMVALGGGGLSIWSSS